MKELINRILKHDYLSKHAVEDPHIASLIRIAEKTKQGNFRGSEEYPELLRPQFKEIWSSIVAYNLIEVDPHFSRFERRPSNKWFSELGNQLHAIEELGVSANKQALDYLRYLSKEDIQVVTTLDTIIYDNNNVDYELTKEEHSFPNARGVLKRFLDFKIRMTSPWREVSPEEIRDQLEMLRRSPSHQVLNKAIATLEQRFINPS